MHFFLQKILITVLWAKLLFDKMRSLIIFVLKHVAELFKYSSIFLISRMSFLRLKKKPSWEFEKFVQVINNLAASLCCNTAHDVPMLLLLYVQSFLVKWLLFMLQMIPTINHATYILDRSLWNKSKTKDNIGCMNLLEELFITI